MDSTITSTERDDDILKKQLSSARSKTPRKPASDSDERDEIDEDEPVEEFSIILSDRKHQSQHTDDSNRTNNSKLIKNKRTSSYEINEEKLEQKQQQQEKKPIQQAETLSSTKGDHLLSKGKINKF